MDLKGTKGAGDMHIALYLLLLMDLVLDNCGKCVGCERVRESQGVSESKRGRLGEQKACVRMCARVFLHMYVCVLLSGDLKLVFPLTGCVSVSRQGVILLEFLVLIFVICLTTCV